MFQLYLFLSIAFLCSCSFDNSRQLNIPSSDTTRVEVDTTIADLSLPTRYNSFDTTVEVQFSDTRDSISDIQKKNYEGFISKQDLLTPDILNQIFEFYKSSYADYRKGWTMTSGIPNEELEKYLPTPTTAENLKSFYTPAIVHIQNKLDCEEGTIGIEFHCTWDIENGLGVSVKNWKVDKASVAEVALY